MSRNDETFGIGGKKLPLLSEFDSESALTSLDENGAPITCGLPLTDTGNAERLVRLHGSRIRYCPSWKKWLLWDGTRWRLDETNRILDLTKGVARVIAQEAALAQDAGMVTATANWAKSSESMLRRSALLAAAEAEQAIVVTADELDRDPWIINCRSGTIDLRTGAVGPHDRALLLTKLIDVTLKGDERCPRWISFLERVLPEPETRSFIQRAVGYSLTGVVGEQVLFFAYGTGANGKSVFFDVLQSIFGPDYACQGAPDLLIAKRNASHPTELADLFGRRLVLCTEVSGHRGFDEPLVKQLTGGDTVRARRMREDFWQFTPTHHIWVSGNQRPQIRGDDLGIWRRMVVIPFKVTIPDEERDPHLLEALRAELPGILRWAIEGCRAWQKEGLRRPEEVAAATADYKDEMDVLGEFLASHLRPAPNARLSAKVLYRAYATWCEESGDQLLSKNALGRRLRERGWTSFKCNSTTYYLNVELILQDERAPLQASPQVALESFSSTEVPIQGCVVDTEISLQTTFTSSSMGVMPQGEKSVLRDFGYCQEPVDPPVRSPDRPPDLSLAATGHDDKPLPPHLAGLIGPWCTPPTPDLEVEL